MDLARLPLFLFFVWLQSATAQVEPPTNVSLHCRNLNNTVEWSYGKLLPGLRFKVKIGANLGIPNPNEVWVDPPSLQADLSFLDPSWDYFVTVAAVMGKNETKAKPGIKFSYFMNSPSSQICYLDFPAVNVTNQPDGKVQISFMHPWLLYHHKFPSGPKKNARKKNRHDAQIVEPLPELKYDVEIVNQTDGHQGFTCEKMVCTGNLIVDPSVENPCLAITGEMEKISIRSTQEYCAQPLITPHEPSDNTYIYIIVVVFLVLFAVALILFMVYKKKTKPPSTLPDSMKFRGNLSEKLRQMTLRTDREAVSVPAVGPASPTPLLTTAEEPEPPTPAGTSSTDYDFRLPIGVQAEDEGVCEDVEAANDEGNQGYMQGNNLEEEDEPLPSSSGYEKRELVVELAPDDQAEGYRGGGLN